METKKYTNIARLRFVFQQGETCDYRLAEVLLFFGCWVIGSLQKQTKAYFVEKHSTKAMCENAGVVCIVTCHNRIFNFLFSGEKILVNTIACKY